MDSLGGLGSGPTQDSWCLGTVGLHLWPVTRGPCLIVHHGAVPFLWLPDRQGHRLPPPDHLSMQSTCPGSPMSPNRVIRAPTQTLTAGQHCTSGKVQWVWHIPRAPRCKVCHCSRATTASSLSRGGKVLGTISSNPAIFPLHS